MTIIKRLLAPTPGFFKVLRNIGLVLTAISGAILAVPMGLPPIVLSIAGYLAVGGSVLSTVSQLTVEEHASQTFDAIAALPAELSSKADPVKRKSRSKQQPTS